MRDYKFHVLNNLVEDMYSWESQSEQYPGWGTPGIGYFPGIVESNPVPIDCLLWRDEDGRVRGILNHYSVDYPPWEKAGNVNIWVDPTWQRRGIGTDLLKECVARFGPLDIEQQKYSPDGVQFIKVLIEEEIVE